MYIYTIPRRLVHNEASSKSRALRIPRPGRLRTWVLIIMVKPGFKSSGFTV